MEISKSGQSYTIFNSNDELFSYLAAELERYSHLSTVQHILLSGGSTPKGLFSYIRSSGYKHRINWSNLNFWWGDERCVHYQDVQSNYGEAKRLLFDHIDIPSQNIHFIPIELNHNFADYEFLAEDYANKMRQIMSLKENIPVYDWVMLGIGEDGHTASLFPNETDLASQKISLCVQKPITNEYRITLSANTLRSAHRISYLVTGKSKAHVVHEILQEVGDCKDYPAYHIRSESGLTEYLLDADAGYLLPKKL